MDFHTIVTNLSFVQNLIIGPHWQPILTKRLLIIFTVETTKQHAISSQTPLFCLLNLMHVDSGSPFNC